MSAVGSSAAAAGVAAGAAAAAGVNVAAGAAAAVSDDAATPEASALIIRPVRLEEYEEAGRVTEAAYVASYDTLTPSYLASLRDVAARAAAGAVWVAVHASDPSDRIVGTVWVPHPGEALSPLARDGELDFRQLAVAPEARGRGVGEALTRAVIDLARARGARRVVMNSGPEMLGAHALYAKIGFRRLTEREAPIEVEPGRWLDLRAFVLDLEPDPVEG